MKFAFILHWQGGVFKHVVTVKLTMTLSPFYKVVFSGEKSLLVPNEKVISLKR